MSAEREIEFWQTLDPTAYVKPQGLTDATLGALLPAIGKSTGVKRPRVLDLGCGDGRLAIPVAKALPKAGKVIGVDVSQGALDLASTHAEVDGVKFEGMLCEDGRTLPDVKRLDAAFSITLFQHLPREAVAALITQVAMYLKKGGVFRFQFVEGDSDEFLTQKYPSSVIGQICQGAGLQAEFERGLVHDCWMWVTAVKG